MFLIDRLLLNRMMDEDSRTLFKARLRYDDSNNYDEFARSIDEIVKRKRMICYEMHETAERLNTKNVIIYGAGTYGRRNKLALDHSDFKVLAYADRSAGKQGTVIDGIPVISPEALKSEEYRDTIILIGSTRYREEIIESLSSAGIEKERICVPGLPIGVVVVNDPEQYFDVFQPEKEEVFLDVGAYDGFTVKMFYRWCRGEYKKIDCFEPSETVLPVLEQRVKDYHDTRILPYAAWKRKETLYFDDNGSGAKIAETGKQIQAEAIDHLIREPVSYIKMDIEGAELAALAGAKKLIRRYHPRLAISVYHKKRDIRLIPLYLLFLVPGYRFRVRHYSRTIYETVLYAETERK